MYIKKLSINTKIITKELASYRNDFLNMQKIKFISSIHT